MTIHSPQLKESLDGGRYRLSMSGLLRSLLVVGTFVFASHSGAAPSELVLKEYLGSEWKDELIGERLIFEKGKFTGAALVGVKGPDGREVPSQVSEVSRHEDGSIASCKVWFLAELPPNAEARYSFHPGKGKAGNSDALVRRSEKGYIDLLADGKANTGLRCLLGEKSYEFPILSDSSLSPIQKILLPSGKKVGEPVLNVPFRVKSWESKLIESGPLFAELRIRYVFDVGYWNFDVKVRKGSPLVEIQEEFNTGNDGQTFKNADRYFEIALAGDGFEAEESWYTGPATNFAYSDLLFQQPPSVLTATGGLPSRANWINVNVSGFSVKKADKGIHYGLTGWGASTPRIGCHYRVVQPDGDAIGFANLREMEWKDPLAIRFRVDDQGRVVVRLPLQKFKQGAEVDAFNGGSPNYTGITLFVAPNTSRRNYAIMPSKAEDERSARLISLVQAAAHVAVDTLDEVRGWVLKWPDAAANESWAKEPTAKGTAALEVARSRTRLHRIAGNADSFSMGRHWGYSRDIFPKFSEVINDRTQLTAEQRDELRRLFAFEAYRMNSGGSFPRGSGAHLNNPNMTLMAVEARALSASLIPDHPHFKQWGMAQVDLIQRFFEQFTMPSGAPFENPHYTLGVSLRAAFEVNNLLMKSGLGDALDDELIKKSMRFIMNWLTPPEPRFLGHRLPIAIGNGSYQSVPPDLAALMVEYYKTRDPELASQLQWFSNVTLPENEAVKIMDKDLVPSLKSGWWKDYGVIFRHGFGTEHETMFHFQAGKCVGHYEIETDQMSYSLFAKGSPIHLHFGNGYFPMLNRPWLRNRISFDMKMEMFERNDLGVNLATFQPEAEYLRAFRETDQLLTLKTEQPVLEERKQQWTAEETRNFHESISAEPEQIPPITWNRQVAFMKDANPAGPNYFVLRDSFDGTAVKPTDLNLWFLANGMSQQGNVFHFDGQVKADMDVFVHTPEAPNFSTGEYRHAQLAYGRKVGFDPAFHPGGKLGEMQKLLRIRQEPGKSYFVVLYPRLKQNDPPAEYARLGEDLVQIKTALGVDVVLMASAPRAASGGDWSIQSRAAALRKFKDGRQVLVNFEGPCEAVVGGQKIRGGGAFTVTVEAGKAVVTSKDESVTVEISATP